MPPIMYNSGGNYARSLAMADLNGDGKLDLVVGNTNSRRVTVFLGDGHGHLGAAHNYALSPEQQPTSVAIADVNADGKLDIVVANYAAANDCGVAVLLGNGDGTFQSPLSFFCTSAYVLAYSVAVGDFNGDGRLDLAVPTYLQVAVLLGNGDGTFQPPTYFPWGNGDGTSWGSNSLAVADLNADGKLDLIVATGTQNYWNSGNGAIAVLLGNGDGTFQPAIDLKSGGSYAWSLAVRDLNGDGKLDVVVANSDSGVGVLLGNGDGTFQPAVAYGSGATTPRAVAIADINGDGKPDLLVADQCGDAGCTVGAMGMLLGNGDGTFQSPLVFATGGAFSSAVVAGDLNRDSKLDIVIANQTCYGVDCGHGSIAVLLNASPYPTSTTVASSLNPAFTHQSITFTATVTASSGTPPNGETITFFNGSAVLGTATLSGGIATLTTSSLPAGIYSVTANYPGDSTLAASTSASLRQVVNSTTKSPTLTVLASNINPAVYGQKMTLTATVTTSGALPPTGIVVFQWTSGLRTFTIGTVNVTSSGVATLTTLLNAAVYPMKAVYRGDINNLPSTSATLTQTVQPTTSKASIASSSNPSSLGQPVTFRAAITSPTVIPTGPVTFKLGTTVLGTAQLINGKASFTTSSLPVGSDVVKVIYSGNSNIAKSSAAVTQAVQP